VDARACRIIGDATNRVCAGELRQVCERGNLRLSEADYFAVIEGKTAALTECCGRLGAIYAGQCEVVVEQVASFGRNLGIAFQIADDLLDLLGDEPTAGKTLGTDLEQRKLTLPVIHCLNRLPAADADSLREAIRAGHPELGRRVLAALERTQSLAYTRSRADEFVRAARQNLECLPRSECRAILEQLTDWSARREK
jgi:octaprenyl-diphosphate synthase